MDRLIFKLGNNVSLPSFIDIESLRVFSLEVKVTEKVEILVSAIRKKSLILVRWPLHKLCHTFFILAWFD